LDIVVSVNGVPIRLTAERWYHIVENHDDLASYYYDEEADVLYISFDRPQRATDSEMLDQGILLRYRDEKLVGLTVFEASKR
jgi:uncharacterized protein YuzE